MLGTHQSLSVTPVCIWTGQGKWFDTVSSIFQKRKNKAYLIFLNIMCDHLYGYKVNGKFGTNP